MLLKREGVSFQSPEERGRLNKNSIKRNIFLFTPSSYLESNFTKIFKFASAQPIDVANGSYMVDLYLD
jgi:hypothetical protein